MQEHHEAPTRKTDARRHQIPPNEPSGSIHENKRARGVQGLFQASAVAHLRDAQVRDEDVLLLAKRWRFQHTRGCIIDYLSQALLFSEPLQVNGVDFFKCVFGQRNREDILPPHEVSFLPAQPALSNRQLDVCQVPSCENVVRLLLPACHLHTASMNARLTCHLDKWAAAC